MKENYRVNNLINYRVVKLISTKSEFLGYFKLKDCLKKAKELKVDLVEISAKDHFSACKLINFNKFLYFQKKKNKKFFLNLKENNKKKIKKNNKIKEIKFHLFIAENDYNNKIEAIKKFLIKGLRVKVTFIIKGREILKTNIIRNNVNSIISNIEPFGNLNNSPNFFKRIIFLYFDPKKC